MSDHIEAARKIKQAGDIVCKDKASASKFLTEIGILDQDGELHENYGGTKKCCKGGQQWGHAWDCQGLP